MRRSHPLSSAFSLVTLAALGLAAPAACAQTYTFANFDDPAGTGDTFASGINTAGQIVGGYVDSAGRNHGFVDTNGVFTTLDDPAAGTGNTYASGINTAGQVIGYYNNTTNNSGYHGFIYANGVFTTLDDPAAGTGNTFASGINTAGQIVGYYHNPSTGTHGFLATPNAAPEPSQSTALALGTVGLTVLALRARRRTASA